METSIAGDNKISSTSTQKLGLRKRKGQDKVSGFDFNSNLSARLKIQF